MTLLRREDEARQIGGREDEARQIFRQEYGDSRNMITPDVVGYALLRNRKGYRLAVEVSQGRSILDSGTLTAMTFVRQYPDGHTRRDPFGMSGLVKDRAEANVIAAMLTQPHLRGKGAHRGKGATS